jgi:hypothetical protein
LAFGKDLTAGQNILKDMATTATGAVGNVGPGISAFFSDPPDGVNMEPVAYQDALLIWIKGVQQDVNRLIVEMNAGLSRMTDNEISPNLVRLHLALALQAASGIQGMEKVPEHTSDEMARTLERSFWAEWILQVLAKDNRASVPSAVAERFEKLGILQAAGTTLSGFRHTLGSIPIIGIFGQTSAEEDQKLVAWARNFKAHFDKSAWAKLVSS